MIVLMCTQRNINQTGWFIHFKNGFYLWLQMNSSFLIKGSSSSNLLSPEKTVLHWKRYSRLSILHCSNGDVLKESVCRGFLHVQSSHKGSFKNAGVFFRKETVRVTSSPAFLKTWTCKVKTRECCDSRSCKLWCFFCRSMLWWNVLRTRHTKSGKPR